MENLPGDFRRAYNDLAELPKYQHFIRIPDRIIQCIDYFGISCDQTLAKTRLHAYYLFIGVVDDAIDSGGIEAGRLILDYLSTPAGCAEVSRYSSVKVITEILKRHMSNDVYPLMMDKLHELYQEVISERAAASIDSYIEHRKSVGRLTAELSYLLIQPDLSDEHEGLCQFMKQVGAVGCLIDSLIDLSVDFRLGLLGFKPGVMDYIRLITYIVRDGLRVSLRHPGLAGPFFRAIGDNLQDRFRAERRSPPPSLISDRKVEPASVA